jgi:hypothetical protein
MQATGHRWVSPRRVLALLALAALVAGAVVLSAADPSALCALPALVLPLLLALRRYPGERLLAVLSAGRSRRERPGAKEPTGARAEFPRPRGSLLLGRALAVRPPPAGVSGAA